MSSEFLPNENFPFDDITVKTPKALQGGTYSAILELNNKPIVIQTPRCKTKKGIHKTSKQIYCDLLFAKDNTENNIFINWLDSIQERVRNLISDNGDNWFHEKPSLDEIEYNWNDSVRTYKGTYNLIRTFIYKNKSLNKLNIQIYDDSENELHLENIDENKNVICILELKGLKFSSQSFHLEIFLRQVMILNEKPIFNKCLIQTNVKKSGIVPKIDTISNEEETVSEETVSEETVSEETVSEKPLLEETVDDTILPYNIQNTLNDSTQDNTKDNTLQNTFHYNEPSGNITQTSTEEGVKNKNDLEISMQKVEKSNDKTEKKEEIIKEELNEKEPENKEVLETNPETLDKNKQESLENSEKNEKNEKNKDNRLELKSELEEINIDISEEESIKLKNASDVYLDIYKKAREKAKKARINAIKAYLEVKRIKELYMLDVADSSDEEEFEDL